MTDDEIRQHVQLRHRISRVSVIWSSVSAIRPWVCAMLATSWPLSPFSLATVDVYRKHGISSAIFYKWKAKYGGLEVSDARKLRALEDENGKLKKLLAEASFNERLRDELLN